MMKISENAFVALDYTLTVDGNLVDRSDTGKPAGFVFGAGQMVEGLENALRGKQTGDTLDVAVSAAEGYGDLRSDLVRALPRENFPQHLEPEVGMVFQADTPHGAIAFRVAEVRPDSIVADLNHPLAGKDLHFSVKVVEVRDATDEELKALSCGGDTDCASGCSCGS